MAHDALPAFQRARSPEQRDVRRRTILDTTRGLLDGAEVADISLREIARTVGCANSNVLRYFGTREGVFLAVLDAEWESWIEAAARDLPRPGAPGTTTAAVAEAIADSLVERPRMCKLMSALSGLLRTGAPPAVMADFRTSAATWNTAAARLLADRVPGLELPAASQVVAMMTAYVAGWWPLAQPDLITGDDPVPAAPHAGRMSLRDGLSLGLESMITGLVALNRHEPATGG
ncbi:TetR/AcrR family transcriptional regulator [Actinacidiphila acididurans]|uniref:TetR/AcrR family transcriptional regulator n=1 Tax=Actinacidiphila acididurans TaxID=2784346 RepID=A0ABS2TSR7_9ACTN|nr:TetR/AcrR family transcriptional regulator [Actinacidiphila acididurans]MBM9506384.1 TetR/AcrR family transcriptional regulator [Actinacidiphila acididurans]